MSENFSGYAPDSHHITEVTTNDPRLTSTLAPHKQLTCTWTCRYHITYYPHLCSGQY